ncbi:hypothetical protein, partial [Klebsiella pneumoniae]|uniref:hypothetical protein n=1 Tax=Klebsiella pneumoniae TaxID=573 RepID=UPI0019516580
MIAVAAVCSNITCSDVIGVMEALVAKMNMSVLGGSNLLVMVMKENMFVESASSKSWLGKGRLTHVVSDMKNIASVW